MSGGRLLLISGVLSNARVWEHQIRYLSEEAEIQVLSPSQDSAEKMVEAVLERAPPTFALAGHSMGGWLCLELLRAAPSRISKVCLLNTSARDDSEEKKAKRLKMIERTRSGDFESLTLEIADFFVENPAVREEVRKMFLEEGAEAFIRQEKALLNRPSCEAVLSTVRCPALVVHAAEDRNFSLEEHEELASKIPNAKLAIIDGSGHMSPMEAPQAVTSFLRYWLSYFYP